MPYDDDYDWDDDGRSYDYDDWDSQYDYDEYDSDEDVDVTLSFNIKEALTKVLNETLGDFLGSDNKHIIDVFLKNILKYFHIRCEQINVGKRKPIAYIKNDNLFIESDMPWNVLWSNRNYDSCEEVDNELADCLDRLFLKNVYINVGNSLRDIEKMGKEYEVDFHNNLRIRKGKANVAPIISTLIERIREGESVDIICETDDLEEIARAGIDDDRDYDRSRNAAADAYFHG